MWNRFLLWRTSKYRSSSLRKENVDLNELLQRLNEVEQTNTPGSNPKFLNVSSLIQYIQAAYHEPLREEFKI